MLKTGDTVNDFCVNDYILESNQIRYVITDCNTLVFHMETWLLHKGNPAQTELHAKGIFVRFLQQSTPKCVQNFKGTANYLAYFFSKKQFVSIRVHSWFQFID